MVAFSIYSFKVLIFVLFEELKSHGTYLNTLISAKS